MKRKMRALLHSTLFRYMASYTMIMVVLVLGAGAYINSAYSASIRQSAIDTQYNKLDKIRAENERYFDTMLGIANQLSLSPYVKPFRFEDDPEQAYHLKKQLIPYTLTNDFIDQLYLLFADDDYLYSSATSMNLDLFLYDLMHFERVTPESFLLLLRSFEGMHVLPCQIVDSVLLDGSNAPMITVIAPFTYGTSGSLVFMIKESVYHGLFKDVIYQARNTYIFYQDELLIKDTPLEVPLWAIDKNAETGAEITASGKEYLQISLPNQKHRMSYVTLLPLDSVKADIFQAQATSALFLLGLSVPCMLLVFYLSKRHVKPLKEISHHFGDNSSDELKAIRTGIEDLHAQITESLPALRSNFVLNLIKGRHHSRREMIEAAKTLLLDFDKRFYMAVLLTVAPDEDSPFPIEGLLPETGDVTGYGAELISKEQYLLLLFSDEPNRLNEWAETLQGEENRVLALSTSDAYENDCFDMGRAYLTVSARFDRLAAKDDMHQQHYLDMRESAAGAAMPAFNADSEKARAYPTIFKAIAYMHENAFDKNLSMSAVADVFELSAVRFSLDFKEVTRMSPSEYLLRMRMEKAQEMLIQTDDSIKDICARVGYWDASGFIRRFKRYMGVTPMQYRQNNKQ